MPTAASQPGTLQSTPSTSGKSNDPQGTASLESPRSEAMLSPTEIAATKIYSSVEEILIDSKKYETEIETLRARPLWLDILIGMAGVGAGFFGIWLYGFLRQPQASLLTIELIAPLTFGIVVFAVRIGSRQARIASLQAAIEILEVRKRTRTAVPASLGLSGSEAQGAPSGGYFDQLVAINVKNLGDYYGLVRLHNDKSFRVSVGAGVVGFILIAAAIAVSLFSSTNQKLPTAISAGSGVITEFIGAVFFLLYSRSVREMGAYFKSLLDVQNILLSLKLVNDTKEDAERVKMVGMMISYLVGRQPGVGKGFFANLTEGQPQTKPHQAAERATSAAAG